MAVARAAPVNILSGALVGGKQLGVSFWGFLGQDCSKQGSGHSGQKKMDGTKHVKIQDMDVDKSPISQETEDNGNVNELALELAKNVVTTAVKTVEDAENPIKNINWITHGEFTAERGRKQIEEFVLTWEYEDCWVHCTKFIEREDLVHSYHYIYCVHWSNPTANIPIAQVSASTYFTIKITKNKPPDMPIEVSYIFEGLSLVHRNQDRLAFEKNG
ncbi:A-kinase anchor protein 14 [Vulpes lagopus]